MIIRPLVRPLVLKLVVGITSVMRQGGGNSGQPPYESASLVLDFTKQLYAQQSAAEANANATGSYLLQIFVNDQYFVEA